MSEPEAMAIRCERIARALAKERTGRESLWEGFLAEAYEKETNKLKQAWRDVIEGGDAS